VSIIVGLVITGLIIYFGWWKTDKIVGFLAGDLDENQLVINTSNLDLYKVIISIFGIWLIIDAIPGLIGIIASQIYCSNNKSIFGSYQDVFGNNIRLGVIQLVELIIGIFLVTGNFVVVKVLRNIWKSGSIHEENDNKQ
jgi:hypothetical protein